MSHCRLKCEVCSTSSGQMFRLSLVPRGFWSKDAGDIALKLCFCDFTALELSCSKLNVNMWHPLLNLSISKIACRRMYHVMWANHACLCAYASSQEIYGVLMQMLSVPTARTTRKKMTDCQNFWSFHSFLDIHKNLKPLGCLVTSLPSGWIVQCIQQSSCGP